MCTIKLLLELRGPKVVPVATSAVAASLLEQGRIAHSVFNIPNPCDSGSVCYISLDSDLAASIRETDLIVWDEIVPCIGYFIEAVNQTLRAIMNEQNLLFGAKFVLFSGEFRQILPVVPKAPRGMIVHLCLKSSSIFSEFHILHLTQNMRLRALIHDPNSEKVALDYPKYLLGV